MKKILSFILSLVLLLTTVVLPFGAFAKELQPETYTGKFYDNHFWYEYDTNSKTLTVYSDSTAQADMRNYQAYEDYDRCKGLEYVLRNNNQFWMHLETDEKDDYYYFFTPNDTELLFYDDIETVKFDDSVKSIVDFLSPAMKNLKSIYLPKALAYLDDFDYNNSTYEIYFTGTKTNWNKVVKFTDYANHFGYGNDYINERISLVNKHNFYFSQRESAANLTYSLSCYGYNYDGKSHTPSMIIKDSTGALLQNRVDYTLEFSNGRTAIGDYKVVARFKGNYYGQKTMHFEVKPKNVTRFDVNSAFGGFDTSWYRQYAYQTDGYELQYSSFKNFEAYVVEDMPSQKYYARRFRKLWHGHTYYVRIRTYKYDVNGNKIYSNYSNAVKVRTR